jgi:hypothetical protein
MIPERYYLAFAADNGDVYSAAPLLPPSAVEMGFEYAYAANDAEALSLARLTYLDMCEHSPQIVSVLYASGVSQVLVVAQPSPAWENEGETAGLMLVDEIRMRLADLRVVCLLSGVPMFALPEFQEIEVGAPMSTATDGRDPEGTRAHMQAALDNHDARYAALRGAYGGDRFVRNVDKLVADWIEWTVLTNVWFADDKVAATVGRPHHPALISDIIVANDAAQSFLLHRARVENCMAMKCPPLFVQDMLGDTPPNDWDALFFNDGGQVAS